jgi:hypothetical protein
MHCVCHAMLLPALQCADEETARLMHNYLHFYA